MLDRIKLGKELGAKAGVTLVELLVVMLIVVILAVSLTPLFRDYVIRAQYTAEAVPVVAEMRTKSTLFQYDRGYLPGVPRTQTGVPLTNDFYTASASILDDGNDFVTGDLVDNTGSETTITPLQGFVSVDEGGVQVFRSAQVNGFDADGSVSSLRNLSATNETAEFLLNTPFHFSNYLDVDYEHYTGNRLRPNHVFYRVDHAGYRSGAHMYVIGVFGDGNGLAAGTGYAVMELHNPTYEAKIVATWERWRPVGADVGQIGIIDNPVRSALFATDTATELRRRNVAWIGNVETLLSTDGTAAGVAQFNAMLVELREAGWNF